MATKEPMFYSLRPKHSGEFEVIAVTTLKPKRYHGSVLPYRETTHGLNRELLGKFPSEQAARDVIATVKKVYERLNPVIDEFENKLKELRKTQRAEVNHALALSGAEPVNG